MSLVIIAPVVVLFENCDAMGFVRSDALGKFEVDLSKTLEESGVDAFVDPRVSATNGFFVELDNMM
eukprot:4564551-Ditylum_brightwellii.AAC.1